jgi:hypothetical protein
MHLNMNKITVCQTQTGIKRVHVGHEDAGRTELITALSNAPGKINELDQQLVRNL